MSHFIGKRSGSSGNERWSYKHRNKNEHFGPDTCGTMDAIVRDSPSVLCGQVVPFNAVSMGSPINITNDDYKFGCTIQQANV